MTDSVVFDPATPRFGLPHLSPGQSQKELFVNEAHAAIDALMHCAVVAEAAGPPANPVSGQSWLVSGQPGAEWAGKAGNLACFQSGQWLFFSPKLGMSVFNLATKQLCRYNGSWVSAAEPSAVSGGSVIDVQARAAIAELTLALRKGGILSSP